MRHIGPIVVEEIELDSSSIRSLHEPKVHVPVVWADQFGPFVTVEIDAFDGID
jgi:hypothetical protein